MKRGAEEFARAALSDYGSAGLRGWAAREGKRARHEPARALWDVGEAVADVQALANRMIAGDTTDADKAEMVRLVGGSMLAPTRLARQGTPLSIARMYAALWKSLGRAGADAVTAATRDRVRPPTFVDVQQAYEALDSPKAVEQHMAELEYYAQGDSSLRAYEKLGEAVDRAAQRSLVVDALGHGDYAYYPAPFSTGWEPVVRAAHPDNLDSCGNDMGYIIIVGDEQDEEGRSLVSHVALFKEEVDRKRKSMVTPVAMVDVEFDLDALFDPDRAWQAEEEAQAQVKSIFSNVGVMPFNYTKGQVDAFLSLLAFPEGPPSVGPHGPLPAGVAEIRHALVPLPSVYSLGGLLDFVISALHTMMYPDRFRLDLGSTKLLRLTECQLAVALRLFTGQEAARRRLTKRKQEAGRRAVSLAEAAALAYGGPIGPGTLPTGVLDAVGQTLWDTTCAAPALPDGRLFNADRLLDLAALWGHQIEPAEAYRPELLCSTIDDMFIADDDEGGDLNGDHERRQ